MLTPVAVNATDEILDAVTRLGRTEDGVFSPDGHRLALAGFGTNRLVVLDVALPTEVDGAVTIIGFTEIHSPWLQDPHGVAFLGDDLIVVANRVLDLTVHRVPPPVHGVHRVDDEPLFRIGVEDVGRALTPGSIASRRVALDLYELLVCNTYRDCITRHLVDVRTQRSVSDEIFLRDAIRHPDGVNISGDRRWVAFSNRGENSVLLFENTPELSQRSQASGALHGISSPHGIRFTEDDEFVLVCDAGAPLVHVYRRETGDWSGDRAPVGSVQVMDDATFGRGFVNGDDGGPKGLTIDPTGRFAAVVAEFQPVAFFSMAAFVGERPPPADLSPPDDVLARDALLREAQLARSVSNYAVGLQQTVAAQAERIRVLEEWSLGLLRRVDGASAADDEQH